MTGRTTRAALTGATAAVAALCWVLLLPAGVAHAANEAGNGSPGSDPNSGIGPGTALLLFVVVPFVIIAAIGGLAWVGGGRKEVGRYRPQRGWTAAPLWFAGPPDPVAAVAATAGDDLVRGGASGSW